MRFMMKVPIPTATENPAVADPGFNDRLRGLFVELGAQKLYTRTVEDRRFEYALFDIEDLSRIHAIARPVSLWLGVKPEFLPERLASSGFPI
jgi:hypothetical protein